MSGSPASTPVSSNSGRAHADADLTALSRLKKALHGRFPLIKSAHLAEILAAGLGYNTHAALLAALGQAQVSFATLACNEQAFRERAAQLGYGDALHYVQLELAHEKMLVDVVARIDETARPEPALASSDLERCASYGIVIRRKSDGSIFATHPVAGALGPHATPEEAAADAVATWLA